MDKLGKQLSMYSLCIIGEISMNQRVDKVIRLQITVYANSDNQLNGLTFNANIF